MTGNGAIALPHQPARVGQATAIEQHRAAAEVHAAILVAQQCPRDVQAAERAMRDVCRMKALAERAFFRFPRAKKTVSGNSVHLARELARCWGNIQYGVAELARDDQLGQSEMQAYAWDVQTNARSVHVFIVPHKRDKRDDDGNSAPEALVDMRDIYENNANNAARRLREAIFAVLPVWFVKQAEDLCRETLKRDDDGKSIHQRIAEVIDWFGRIGIREEQIAAKLGRASSKWDEQDLANLGVIYRSIKNGEVTKEDEFPVVTVSAAEITASTAPATRDPELTPGSGEQREDEPPAAGTSKSRQDLMRHLFALLGDGGVSAEQADRAKRMRIVTRLLNRPKPVTTFNALTDADLTTVIDFLTRHKAAEDLTQTLAELAADPAAANGSDQ